MYFEADVLMVIAKERIGEAEHYAERRRLWSGARAHPRRPLRVRFGSAIIWIGTRVMGPHPA